MRNSYAHGRAYLLRETMASLERRLNPANFLRIHRSRIARSASIVELRSIENREFVVRLSDARNTAPAGRMRTVWNAGCPAGNDGSGDKSVKATVLG